LKKIFLLGIIQLLISFVFAQQKYWQQEANFNITVSLNDVDNTLTGFEEITYTNNSPDTLNFIWFHLWPNAYKNDKTAFSDQLLENGNTAFYFSEENKKGYINQLNFKVDKINAFTEDHPQHQDIIKLILPQPLAPSKSIKIETPFKVKLPYNFSRGGHTGQSYQITQWYPKPAVYDKNGWHEMPYLDQGEFYSEFGNFDVEITLPANYIVAATGELQNEKKWLKEKYNTLNFRPDGLEHSSKIKSSDLLATPVSSKEIKTINFKQNNIHDFAWFADKRFNIRQDTLKLNSGRIINVYAYFLPQKKDLWVNSISFMKKAILTKCDWIGEYPYNVMSVVDDAAVKAGGMEYPTVTILSAKGSEAYLEQVINHEIGHNWFYGILATDERKYPWMDEGINSYYDLKYGYKMDLKTNDFISKRLPEDIRSLALHSYIKFKKDQPIYTSSENFSQFNYGLIGYYKSALFFKKLEAEIGIDNFDKAMQAYFEKWKFKHPQPEDLKQIMEAVSGKSLDNTFSLLNQKGSLETPQHKKQIKLTSFFNTKETDKYNYISLAPVAGYNFYDKLMVGGLIHNYNLPSTAFQFAIAPMYATGTKKLNGIARAEYNWFPKTNGDKLTLSVAASLFTGGSFKDSTGKKNPLQYSKIVPSLKYVFANNNPRSYVKKYIQFKTFIIKETNILFTRDVVNNIDVITYPTSQRFLNQLQIGIENNRKLYPYNGIFQAEQGEGFVRLNFTGNYYFNYAKGGGLDVRFFVGKFIYTGDKSFATQYKTYPYHFNMTGAKGEEDYNYTNYFIGRNEFEGFASQQIMNRDGFFKVRTDLLSSKVGRTDDWLSAVNLITDIPDKINILNALPVKIPVRIFVDIGTYAEAWKKNSTSGRLLYDAGFQLSLFKNVLNIYVPVLYSKVYGDYFKSTIPEKRFQKNISFSIDIQRLKVANFFPQLNL
jgi:Peptidase family M1 domain